MATNNANNEPTSASGTVLQGQGVGTTSAFSTATYPATTTVNQILYSSATNTVTGLATANSGVLSTSTSGVPSIDTTNFQVLSTGLQLKGNNTNTAPPAGFIGELQSAAVTTAFAISVNTITPITSLTPTAGIYEITGIVIFDFSASADLTNVQGVLATANNNFTAIDSFGNNVSCGVGWHYVTGSNPDPRILLGPSRLVTSGSTVVYLNGYVTATSATATVKGLIRAVRVG